MLYKVITLQPAQSPELIEISWFVSSCNGGLHQDANSAEIRYERVLIMSIYRANRNLYLVDNGLSIQFIL